jgi:hypothetical protein
MFSRKTLAYPSGGPGRKGLPCTNIIFLSPFGTDEKNSLTLTPEVAALEIVDATTEQRFFGFSAIGD